MSKKKTHEEYVAELAIKNPNVEVIENYINSQTKIAHRCKIDGYIWNITPNNILQGEGCPNCYKINKTSGKRRKTHEEYVIEVASVNPNIEVIGKYINSKTKILHRCKNHNIEWKASPTNILRGMGCYKCGIEKSSTKRSKLHELYIEELRKNNSSIIVLEKYINARTPILHKCLIDGYEWKAKPDNILSGTGCPKCAGNIKRTHDDYVKQVSIINPNIEVIGKYVGAKKPILHLCKIHNVEWNVCPYDILQGSGCLQCRYENTRINKTKSHEQYIEEVKTINPDICVIGTYVDLKTPILHKCSKDGYLWETKPSNILFNGCGCPQCHETSGERKVRQWLEKHNIAYIFQKTFDNCRDLRLLPFDFYLPDFDTVIEYDHKQHYEPIEHFGGQEAFELRIKHDNIKNEYCKNNGISLLRIPYFKNVEEELNNFLFI